MPTDDLWFALFDEAPVYMTFHDGAELRLAHVNRRCREAADMGVVIGKTARELLQRDPRTLAILERVYETGEAATLYEMPREMPPERGVPHTVYLTRNFIPIRGVDGTVRGVLNVTSDVTGEVRERVAREEIEKRSQVELQRMFALLDEAPVMFLVVEYPDWRVTMANRLNRELMGDRPHFGMRVRDIVGADNPTLAAIERVFTSGRSESDELVSEVPSFAGRSFHRTIVPIRDPDGAGGRVMIVAVETTDGRRASESLEKQAHDLELARREAVEAGRAKDQFLAMLGHELRNPLAPMLTAVQVLELDGITSPALGLIERQIRQLTRLVDDLLDTSRIARGTVVLHRQDLQIATVVSRAIEIALPLIDQRGHRLVTDLHGGLTVSADPDRLAQVIANLVTNAAKYSEPESQIKIVGERNGDRVVLKVLDHGIGIAPEMLQRVFEPFVQQPQTLERSQGGLGLGLSIVKSLVEAHGGTVSAHSGGLGSGSTFVVDLPATDVRRTPPSGSVRVPPISRPASHAATTPLRILVVDDNYEAADILQIALSALGHSIAIAYDGASALDLAKTHAPQIALVDLGLPLMDGYTLAEALRTTHRIPVVAITGYGQETDRQRTHAAGFAAHLVKPVDLHELGELVSRLGNPR